MYSVLTFKLFCWEDGLFLIANAKAALGAGWPTRQPRCLLSTPTSRLLCSPPFLPSALTHRDQEIQNQTQGESWNHLLLCFSHELFLPYLSLCAQKLEELLILVTN